MTGRIPPIDYAATAIRPAYATLPESVRRRIAEALGGEPVEVAIAGGGFTTGFAARVRAASGAELFVKAAGPLTPEVHDVYQLEARVNTVLPLAVPAPALRFHAEIDEWTVVGFEALQGKPVTLPMQAEKLDLMLRAWADAVDALNPPSPSLIASGVTPKSTRTLCNFQTVAGGAQRPFELPSALTGRWDELAEIETGVDQIFVTDQVTHGDLRPDNMVVGERQAWICDWNKLRFMPPWVDTVCLLATAHGDGHDAERLFWNHPTASGVSNEELDTLLAAITGAMLLGWQDAPRRIVSPAIQDHMRWTGLATADWLAARRSW